MDAVAVAGVAIAANADTVMQLRPLRREIIFYPHKHRKNTIIIVIPYISFTYNSI